MSVQKYNSNINKKRKKERNIIHKINFVLNGIKIICMKTEKSTKVKTKIQEYT